MALDQSHEPATSPARKGELTAYVMLYSIAAIPSGTVGFMDGRGVPVEPTTRAAALGGPVVFNGAVAYCAGATMREIGRRFNYERTTYYKNADAAKRQRIGERSDELKQIEPFVGVKNATKKTSLTSIVSYSLMYGVGAASRLFY